MLFPHGRQTTAASQHISGSHAVLALEESGEMSLVGKAGAKSDVREDSIRVIEHATRALETMIYQIAVGGETHRLLERTREVRRRQSNFVCQILHRKVSIHAKLYQFERAPFRGGG
jgi:hypothetical protein